MKRIIVSAIAALMLGSIAIPAFATGLEAPNPSEAMLLQNSQKALRPEKFKGIVRLVDTQKDILFLKKRGKKERILLTPKTVIVSFAKDSVGLASASDLNTGDPVFGFVRRVPKLEVEDNEIFYLGLVIIKVDMDEEDVAELQADPSAVLTTPAVVPVVTPVVNPTPGPVPPAGSTTPTGSTTTGSTTGQ